MRKSIFITFIYRIKVDLRSMILKSIDFSLCNIQFHSTFLKSKDAIPLSLSIYLVSNSTGKKSRTHTKAEATETLLWRGTRVGVYPAFWHLFWWLKIGTNFNRSSMYYATFSAVVSQLFREANSLFRAKFWLSSCSILTQFPLSCCLSLAQFLLSICSILAKL